MSNQILSDKKAQTQDRILEVAARAIRQHGYHGVGVADLMKEAGLTHGGFYAHFQSRNAMLVKAVERAAKDSVERNAKSIQKRVAQGDSLFKALISSYLSDGHLQSADLGCPIAALGSEIARQDETVRQASVNIITRLQKAVAASLSIEVDSAPASFIVSALVGALQLARAQGDNLQGRATLSATRQVLLTQFDH